MKKRDGGGMRKSRLTNKQFVLERFSDAHCRQEGMFYYWHVHAEGRQLGVSATANAAWANAAERVRAEKARAKILRRSRPDIRPS